MSARSPYEAAQELRVHLQRSISCVTTAVLDIGGGYFVSTEPHTLSLLNGDAVRLAGRERLGLSVKMQYRLIDMLGGRRSWDARIVTYLFALLDADDREIVAYHWRPFQRSRETGPHLHLGPGGRVGRTDLANAHLPSGMIELADVVRLAIVEFGVRPLRDDWRLVLDRDRTGS